MSTSFQNKLNQLERRLMEENSSRERDRARNFDSSSSSGPRRPSRPKEDLIALYGDGENVTNGNIYHISRDCIQKKKLAIAPALMVCEWIGWPITPVSLHSLRLKMKKILEKSRKLRRQKLAEFHAMPFSFPRVANYTPTSPPSASREKENDSNQTPCTPTPSPSSGNKVITCEDQKNLNFLEFKIEKAHKQLNKLKSDIKKHQQISSFQNTYYNPINVRRREKARLLLLNNTRKQLIILKETQLKNQQTIDTLTQNILKERKLRSYYKRKADRKVRSKREKENKKPTQTEEIPLSRQTMKYKIKNKRFSTLKFNKNMRLCVFELLALEVSTSRVSQVIDAVSRHIFHYKCKLKTLPSRQTVLRMSDEAHFLIKVYYNDRLKESSSFGVNKDGTTRKKQKILECSITLDSNEALPLGFRCTAKEDASSITENTVRELEELATCSLDGKEGKAIIIEKLNYFMSDRAANEKKSSSQLQQWVEEERIKNQIPAGTLYTIHCMVHVLLGFHRYGLERLFELQKILFEDDGPLGRDAHPLFRFWKKENVTARIVRMTSELLGPNVDEKNGIRDRWLTDCRSRNRKSLIGDYRDNRFNGIFLGAAQIIFHLDEILSLERRLKTNNKKVKSMFLDLKDSRIITMVQAVSIIYIKITEPYWRLTMNHDINYMELFLYIQPFFNQLKNYSVSPKLLLEEDCSPFESFPPDKKSPFFQSSFEIRHPDRMNLLLQAIQSIINGILKTVNNQLSDFLDGGKYSTFNCAATNATKGSGLTNMSSERNFGSLDASQKRRRHASLHYHSTILMLKSNRTIFFKWFLCKTKKQQFELIFEAQRKGRWLREKHRAEEKEMRQKEIRLLEEETSKSQQKGPSTSGNEVVSFNLVHEVNPGQYVAVAFETGWFPGMVLDTTTKKATIKFLHHSISPGVFKWPSQSDVTEIDIKFILSSVDAPTPVSGGRMYILKEYKEVDEKFVRFSKKFFYI